MTDELPPRWALTTLGEIVDPPRPKASPASYPDLPFVGMDQIAPNGMELLGMSKFGDMKSNGGLFFDGDVLYGRMRPYLNKVHRAKFDGACSAEFIVMPVSDAVDGDFLAYLLHHRRFVNFASNQSSGDRPRVDFGEISGYELNLPPTNEQRRIVSKVDELFSRIDEGEAALARVEKLVERYRQSVLKAAVTGELTRDWRAAQARANAAGDRTSGAAAARKRAGEPVESGEALLARILKARRAAWEAAELAKLKAKGKPPTDDRWKQKYQEPAPPDTTDLPELPEGWVWASPVQLEASAPHALTIGPFGSDLKVSDYQSIGVPLVFVRNIRNNSFAGPDTRYVSQDKANRLSAHTAKGGDILITKMGDPPGDACIYPAYAPDAVITADCIKWSLHPLIEAPSFACAFVNSQLGKRQIASITTGVAQQKVSLARFRKLAVCIPGLAEQRQIVERMNAAFEASVGISRVLGDATSRSAALRQSILKAAFSGQLVPQDPHDEPASQLLERIAAERAQAPAKARHSRKTRGSTVGLQSD